MKDMLPYQAKMQKVGHLVDGPEKLAEAVNLARGNRRCDISQIPDGGSGSRRCAAASRARWDEAAAVYQSVLDKQPDCIKAHARLGDYYASQGRWRQAR